ncbi:MAG: tail fiber domain-containing protein [Alphaproteobacteria bacterium]|nr:tail fiber domain-containing protein [Alphaproteobacteria bacterium]
MNWLLRHGSLLGRRFPGRKGTLAALVCAVVVLAPSIAMAVVGTAGGTVPIGTTSTSSMLGVYGNVSIGTSYTGTAAPTNGAIIQGSLGIGTTSPANALDVYSGGIRVRSNTPSNTSNALYASSSTLYFNGGSISGNSWYTTGGVNIGSTAAPANGQLVISGSGGSYGIIVGTTGTGNPFKIFAQSYDHLYLGANGSAYMMWRGSGSGTTGWVGVRYSSISSTIPAAAIDVNGSGRATSYVTSSDRRWKKSIEPFKNAMDKVGRLQGVNFFWRTDEFPERDFGTGKNIGLIAQDVEKVVPEVVSADGDGFMSIEYEKFSSVLIEALKSLKAGADGVALSFRTAESRVAEREAVLSRQAAEIEALAATFEGQRREFLDYKKMHP